MMAQPIFMERLTVFQPKKPLSHNTIIIEIFRSNISSIIPEDSLVESKLNKLFLVLQFSKCRIFQKRLQINLLRHSVIKCTKKSIIS